MVSSSSSRFVWLGLMVFYALIVQFQISLCTGCWDQERDALLQIKDSMSEYSKPPDYHFPDSWQPDYGQGSGLTDCCVWEGVECNVTTGKVIKLMLSGASYQWPLNALLFLPFEDLTVLDLSNNHIRSWVPNQGLGRLQALENLEVLNLGGNNFSNSMPPSLGLHSSLKALSLYGNQFTGSFDVKELLNLSKLEELDLAFNEITDVKGLESLSKLTLLSLRGMKLSASSSSVLQSVGALRSLKTLDISENHLQGFSFANASFGFSNLIELDLSLNDLKGVIPPWLGNLTSVQVLDLSRNQFHGNLALSPVANLHTLKCLNISYNNLEIPASLTSFSNHSKLKAFLSENNTLVSDEIESHSSRRVIPKFQLQVLSLFNCGSKNLVTRLPSFLHFQSDLKIVDMAYVNLALPFPTWLLDNNTLMEQFIMRGNSLTGTFLPQSHQIFPNTYVIDISDNRLAGQVLENIGRTFPNLCSLNMSGNQFGGIIPDSIGDLTYLKVLDLSNNNLSGEIPESLGIGCPILYTLELSNNNLSGKLPSSLANLTGLLKLYLDGNHIVGELPDSFSAFHLKELDLSNNHISGKLPRWIGNMSFLSAIALASNHLEGSIPVEFCELGEWLIFINLSDNNLTGSIPSCFSPPSIMHVHLNRNKLSGPMTRAFQHSSSLVTLDLFDNSLTGNIPSWLGNLPSLSVLLLKNNSFDGEIPVEICNLERLSLLDLSHNSLFGPLPRCLSKTPFKPSKGKTYMLGLYPGILDGKPPAYSVISFNRLKLHRYGESSLNLDPPQQVQIAEFGTKFGSYLYQGSVLELMSGIDLSCNHLTGEIPDVLGNLSGIHALNLSHNYLTGPIPTTFSNLKAIESLDLSYNNLIGRIPSELVELVSLGSFSVAHNNLSGPVPDRKAQFGTFDEKSYEGNPLLCDPPLHDSCSTRTGTGGAKPKAPEKEVNHEDMLEFYASFGASYVTVLITIAAILVINPRWRRMWFYYIEVWMIYSYNFVLDTLCRLINKR